MKTLRVHWRHRHATTPRLQAMAEVLAAHPGPDQVIVDLTGTGQSFRLPVTVAADRALCRAVHHATEETGSAFVVDPALLWP